MIPGATYHVTHPYEWSRLEADEDGPVFCHRGHRRLDDGRRTYRWLSTAPVFGNLLRWDPAESVPPAGYLGDPGVEHTVTGSPKGTDFFKVEGPAGSFGPARGLPWSSRPTAAASVTDLFSIMGKHAQTSGVQTMRAVRIDQNDASSDYLEVFATSRPGQKIMLSVPVSAPLR